VVDKRPLIMIAGAVIMIRIPDLDQGVRT